MRVTARHRSTAWPLVLAFIALVVYASLYPFTGWRWPAAQSGLALLQLPWPPWRDRFDEAANLIGYVPLGALWFVAVVRSGGRATWGVVAALGGSAALSYGVEVTQSFLPTRVPSLKDCAFNLAGSALGAMVGALILALGGIDRWQSLRERWFKRRSAGALLLLLLWPIGLLFPAPVPLGLGQIGPELRAGVEALLAGTPWAVDMAAWLGQGEAATGALALSRVHELLATSFGLAAPCLLAFSATRRGWHRLVMLAGAVALAMAVTTLSTALNFGPEHALAWWTATTWRALVLGAVLAGAAIAAGPRLAASLGLALSTALVVLVAQAPTDPYYAASLQGWEQGRFIRFHGLAQWVGWLWPYAAMVWLLTRISRRADD